MAVNKKEQQSWTYWRDKKGYEEALTEYCPNSMRDDETLRLALVQLKSAEALIDKLMTPDDPYEGIDD